MSVDLPNYRQPARAEIREVLKEIETDCGGRGFELKKVASGYRFQVRQEYGEWVGRLWDERPPRYSRALLETLALIAYKQPITRGDIEEIRGVAVSTNIMRSLLEREWVRVVGHRDVPGRPAIYATTKSFLDYFDLNSLEELPTLSDIKDLVEANEELDLEDELMIAHTIELGEDDPGDTTGIEDADLAKVTEKVNAIQDNIRNLFDQDDLDQEEKEDELQEDEANEKDSTPGIQTLASTVPEEILNAAFAEEPSAALSKEQAADTTPADAASRKPQGKDDAGTERKNS